MLCEPDQQRTMSPNQDRHGSWQFSLADLFQLTAVASICLAAFVYAGVLPALVIGFVAIVAVTPTTDNAIRVGSVAFVTGILAGVVLTRRIVNSMLDGLPRTEVYEALYRDGLACRYTLTGWYISVMLSAIVASLAFGFAARFWR